MYVYLLNMGFVKRPDGSYYNNELGIAVTIKDDKHVVVDTPSGPTLATIEELEDAILSGAFGAY
jgi:hypothetical protein